MMNKRETLIAVGVLVVILVAAVVVFDKPKQYSGEASQEISSIPVVPLSAQQRQVATETIQEAEFLKDLPKDEPVEIIFYDFENGERRYRDKFIVTNEGIVTNVKPTLYVYVHSKYIDQMENEDFCGVVQQANKNGDLGTYSDYSNFKLLIKYSGMLKHKSCIGL